MSTTSTSPSRSSSRHACLRLPSGGAYLSFRGTDNTLVGFWKEDFNMAFETGVPSQYAAIAYLGRGGAHDRGAPCIWEGALQGWQPRRLCRGALPGGYRGARARVFSHDGPGFTEEALADELWKERSGLVSKTVPRSSVIGMLFERQEDYACRGVLHGGPHPAQPLLLGRRGDGLREDRRVSAAGRASSTRASTSGSPAHDARGARGVRGDALSRCSTRRGEDTFADLSGNWQASVPAMLRRLGELEPEQRGHITRALALLAQAFMRTSSCPSSRASSCRSSRPGRASAG